MLRIHERFGNATVVSFGDNFILFSYKEPVAINTPKGFKVTEKKFSNTTTRHINKWLNGASYEAVPHDEIVRLAAC